MCILDKLYSLLLDIKKRPESYIGKPSLERLYAYLNGYLDGVVDGEKNDGDIKNENCLVGFNEYIMETYRINSDHNWSSIIQFFSNTETQAFDKFYEELENFIQEKNG